MNEIKIGDVVRFAPEWCSPGERKYIHVVLEKLLNPVTGKETRFLIETLNTGLFIKPRTVVEGYMIELYEEE